jgi:hypothetical protein
MREFKIRIEGEGDGVAGGYEPLDDQAAIDAAVAEHDAVEYDEYPF